MDIRQRRHYTREVVGGIYHLLLTPIRYNAGALVLWKPGIEKLRPRKRARDSSDDEDEEIVNTLYW